MFGSMLGGSDGAKAQMGELTDRLKSEAGLTDEQTQKVLETIKDFVVEKYPMLQGAVDSVFGK